MHTKSIISLFAVTALLLTGCASEKVSSSDQVQNCMDSFLKYVDVNLSDDPAMHPKGAEFDDFLKELKSKCESDQKDNPNGFYEMYSIPTENVK